MHYSQPDEYHFSHDSVFLARQAFELQPNAKTVMDLCAGCGVVGIDYLLHRKNENRSLPERIDFLELQSIYQSHFVQNITAALQADGPPISYHFMNLNYDQVFQNLKLEKKYDLILSNPPYFRIGQGSLSPSDFKNRCRFFLDSDLNQLIRAIHYLLAPEGKALVLIKSLSKHGFVVEDEIARAAPIHFEKRGLVRDTDLFEIRRRNE